PFLGLPLGVPREYEALGSVRFDHLAHDHDLGHAIRLHLLVGEDAVAGARAQLGVVLDDAAVAVADGPFGLGDGVPHLLRGRLDEHPVHLGDRRSVGHCSSSSSLFSSVSACAWRSRYLWIHRSWIAWMGTGFR